MATLTTPKYMFPRFYIKAVGGKFTLMHRLTHSFLGSFETEKELAKDIKDWNTLDEREFWEVLLDNPLVRVTSRNAYDNPSEFSKNEEEWYHTAWCGYTGRFYDKYPKLLIEEPELPYSLINEIRQIKFKEQDEVAKAMEEEKREAEKKYLEQVKVEKVQAKQKPEEIVGKIGNRLGIDKLRNKQKKAKKKVTIKTKSNKVIIINDSESLFD